jgi:hypothetical protein
MRYELSDFEWTSSMIRKSEYRFSEKIMLKQEVRVG